MLLLPLFTNNQSVLKMSLYENLQSIFYLMYLPYELNYQSVVFNAKLGRLCVMLSLKGQTTVHTFQHCKFSKLCLQKVADI